MSVLIKCQYIETGQLICTANQLTGFYTISRDNLEFRGNSDTFWGHILK